MLQALSSLQETGSPWRIENVDYLSSVSGGGYAAAGWLSALLFATSDKAAYLSEKHNVDCNQPVNGKSIFKLSVSVPPAPLNSCS